MKDFESCSHPGCLNHITHPCEWCGRIGGKIITDDIKKLEKALAPYLAKAIDDMTGEEVEEMVTLQYKLQELKAEIVGWDIY